MKISCLVWLASVASCTLVGVPPVVPMHQAHRPRGPREAKPAQLGLPSVKRVVETIVCLNNEEQTANQTVLARTDNTVSYGTWTLRKAAKGKSQQDPLELVTESEADDYAFDKEFEHSKLDGTAFLLLKPLDSNLAGGLQISRNRDPASLIRYSTDAKEITVGLLDGSTTNRVDVLHIDQRTGLQYGKQTIYKNVSAHMYKMRDMAVLGSQACKVDLDFMPVRADPNGPFSRSSGAPQVMHDVFIRSSQDSREGVVPCIPPDTVIQIQTHNLTPEDREYVSNIVTHLFLWEMLILLASLYCLRQEQQLYIESAEERLFRFAHGREHPVYATNVSQVTLVLTFNSHFGIAVIYCQLMESVNFTGFAVASALLALANLYYVSKILGIRIRIHSVDLAASPAEQGSYISWTQIKICKYTFLSELTLPVPS
jgi:hypothetical protein